MSDGFTAGAGTLAPAIFTCPKCAETIDSSAEKCRFCGEKVDPEEAQRAALVLSKINQACSDASYMKSTTLALPVFFILRFVPFISGFGVMGFIGVSAAVPIWAARWWFKYGNIATTDEEFQKARSTVKICGFVAAGVLVFLVILPFLAEFLLIALRRG